MLLFLRSVSSIDKREVSVARVLSEASLVTVAEARACSSCLAESSYRIVVFFAKGVAL
jgi:hypothetical protein